MKKKLFFAILLVASVFISCQKDNSDNEFQGILQFGLGELKPQTDQKSLNSDDAPASILFTICDSKEVEAIESKKIPLMNMYGSYISESFSLKTGNYIITKFLVLNNSDSVIYASPLQGSSLSYLVTKPLPISFTINKNSVTKVVPEVLSGKRFKAEDFGYSGFSFELIKTFDFLTTVMVYNSSFKIWEPTTANITISTAEKTFVYNGSLTSITNKITLRDNSLSYTLIVGKAGYHTYTSTFTSDELKLYFRPEDKGQLIIRLNELVTDIDGNIYNTIVIGTQVWMTENLKTTHLNDGSYIQLVAADDYWKTLTTPAYCWYQCKEITNKNLYGGLYNWYSVGTGKLCPLGWQVATNGQWSILSNYLSESGYGYHGIAYFIAKSMASTSNWVISSDPDFAGPGYDQASNNSSGFNATPGGERGDDGIFEYMGAESLWWTGIESSSTTAWYYRLSYGDGRLTRGDFENKQAGFSVRCIKN